jgi:hypothetical protein
MVRSKIDVSVEYEETLELLAEDVNYAASVYEIEYEDLMLNIALGRRRTRTSAIDFYPFYLLNKHNQVLLTLGVYEVMSHVKLSILDEDGDVDITKLAAPLFYDRVTRRTVVETLGLPATVMEALPTQNVELARQEHDAFDPADKTAPWIQRFMRSAMYSVVQPDDEMARSPSLFLFLSQALLTTDKKKTETFLRELLAQHITHGAFDMLKHTYDQHTNTLKGLVQETKAIDARQKVLQAQLNATTDLNRQGVLVKEATGLKEHYEQQVQPKLVELKSMVQFHFGFMKNIANVEMLRLKVQTTAYTGDLWSLSILERLLQVKVILLSVTAFHRKEYNNVVVYPPLEDTYLIKAQVFAPTHYILAEFEESKNKFSLIEYRKHRLFKFQDLPFDLKRVLSKRVKTDRVGAGAFALIPDLQQFDPMIPLLS